MGTISITVFRTSKNEMQERLIEKLHVINNLKTERILSHFERVNSSINHIEYNSNLGEHIDAVLNLYSDNDSLLASALEAKSVLETEFKSLEKTFGFHRISLKGLDGSDLISSRVVKNLSTNDSLLYKTNSNLLIDARKKIVYSDIYHPRNREDRLFITVMAPYSSGDQNNTKVDAILACEISMNEIYKGVTDTTGLGVSGETILTKRIGNQVHFISRPRDYIGDFLNQKSNLTEGKDQLTASELSVFDKSERRGFAFEVKDYKNVDVDVAWSYIPQIDWGIMTKINHSEAFTSIKKLQAIIIFLCVGILFFSIIIITIFVDRFLTPIINIRNNMVRLAKGQFPKRLTYEMSDEIQDTTMALNNLVKRLKNSTDFARRIGEGDLNAEYHGNNDQDVLSKSLLNMRKSLRNIESENELRKWATEGLALHTELFRKNNESLELLGKQFISSLIQYINGVHGAVYCINHLDSLTETPSDRHHSYFEIIGTYAFDLKEGTPTLFAFGQGLVGEAAKEMKTLTFNGVPDDFLVIGSGLGKSKATFIACIPMIVNNRVMGVVEIADFKPLEPHVIQFVEMLGENFASTVLHVKVAEQTQQTLKEFEANTLHLKQKELDLQERYDRALNEINHLKKQINRLEMNLRSQNH